MVSFFLKSLFSFLAAEKFYSKKKNFYKILCDTVKKIYATVELNILGIFQEKIALVVYRTTRYLLEILAKITAPFYLKKKKKKKISESLQIKKKKKIQSETESNPGVGVGVGIRSNDAVQAGLRWKKPDTWADQFKHWIVQRKKKKKIEEQTNEQETKEMSPPTMSMSSKFSLGTWNTTQFKIPQKKKKKKEKRKKMSEYQTLSRRRLQIPKKKNNTFPKRSFLFFNSFPGYFQIKSEQISTLPSFSSFFSTEKQERKVFSDDLHPVILFPKKIILEKNRIDLNQILVGPNKFSDSEIHSCSKRKEEEEKEKEEEKERKKKEKISFFLPHFSFFFLEKYTLGALWAYPFFFKSKKKKKNGQYIFPMRSPFFFTNLSFWMQVSEENSAPDWIILSLIELLEAIPKNWIFLKQINPWGDLYGYFQESEEKEKK